MRNAGSGSGRGLQATWEGPATDNAVGVSPYQRRRVLACPRADREGKLKISVLPMSVQVCECRRLACQQTTLPGRLASGVASMK